MKKVAAVVVTYNRLELLKRSIESLRDQTYKEFDIVIVNNGSTDGTTDWIGTLNDVIVINQENCGGAGGFYTGQKYAYDNGYEWVWMMDDDGVADKDELNELVSCCVLQNILYANALVVNIEDRKSLAFHPTVSIETVNTDKTHHYFSPYNGTLINRRLFDKIGFIKREMFIWGDELEYSYRAQKFGHHGFTITKAIHYHPQNKGKKQKVFPLLNVVIELKPKHFSKYFFRNRGYIEKTYSTAKVRMCSYIFYTILYLKRLEFGELFKFWKYYTRGIHNNYKD